LSVVEELEDPELHPGRELYYIEIEIAIEIAIAFTSSIREAFFATKQAEAYFASSQKQASDQAIK
jgi:hypothetical protein